MGKLAKTESVLCKLSLHYNFFFEPLPSQMSMLPITILVCSLKITIHIHFPSFALFLSTLNSLPLRSHIHVCSDSAQWFGPIERDRKCVYTECVVAASAQKYYANVREKSRKWYEPALKPLHSALSIVSELTAHLHIFHACMHAYVCIHSTIHIIIEYNCARYTFRKPARQFISHTSACVCYVNRSRKLTFDKQKAHTTVHIMSHKQSMQSVCSNTVFRLKNTIFLFL